VNKLDRLEIWDDVACNSGVRLAVVPDCIGLVDTLTFSGRDKLIATLPRESAAWASVTAGRIVRAQDIDGYFEEWRIAKDTQARAQQRGKTATISCESIRQDLLREDVITRTDADGTVSHDFEIIGLTASQLLTSFILPAAPSYFASGTIDPTIKVEFRFDWDSPLAALLEIAKLTNSRLAIRRNGTTSYYVDLLVDATPANPEIEFRVRKNIRAIQYERNTDEQATRIYPRGESIDDMRLTMAGALWEIDDIVGLNMFPVDPNNASIHPVAFDDQLNDMSLYIANPSGDMVKVVDCVASSGAVAPESGHISDFSIGDLISFHKGSVEATGTATTADADGEELIDTGADFGGADDVRVGDWVHNTTDNSWAVVTLVESTTKLRHTTLQDGTENDWDVSDAYETIRITDLTYLDSPDEQTTYGIIPRVLDRSDVPWVRNRVANPQLNGTYASGLAPNWNVIGTPVNPGTENTDALYTRRGGKSQKVETRTGDAGLYCDTINIAPSANRPYFSGYVTFWLVSGAVRVELLDVTNGRRYPTNDDGRAYTTKRGVWVDLGVAGIDLYKEGCTQIQIHIVSDADGADTIFYLDSAQITQSAGQLPFYPGDGALELWKAANDELILRGVPRTTVNIDIVDLTRIDDSIWPYDDLDLGDVVRVVDDDLDVSVTTRLVELSRNHLIPGTTRVQLSNKPEDLTDALLRPRRRKRIVSAPSIGYDDPRIADPAITAHANAGEIIYNFAWDAESAFVDVWTHEHAATGAGNPPITGPYYAGRVYPGQTQLVIATADNYRTTYMVAYHKDGTKGKVYSFENQATDTGSGPSSAPTNLTIGTETQTTIPITWTNGDSSAQTRVYVDGVVESTRPAGATSYTIEGLDPNTNYEIEIDHYKNGQPSSKDGPDTGTTTSLGTLNPPTLADVCGQTTTGVKAVWQNEEGGAQTVIGRHTVSGGPYTEIKTVGAGLMETTHADGSGLYYFKVRHRKAGWTDSAWSSLEASATYYASETCEE
jgi:hypothetical protein